MSLLLATIILCLFYSLTNSEWISHSQNTMPRDDSMCAIGSYNNRIFLLGGFEKMNQKTIYDIQTDSFVLYKSGFIPATNKVFGEAQYYTQLGHNLYILDDLESSKNIKLLLYNLANNSFISVFDFINATISDGMGRSCITSSSVYNKLYINGGLSASHTPMNETYVLHIESMTWNLTAQMQTPRRSHSCICDNNYLYSIGGASIDSLTATIEKISIINSQQNEWIYLNGLLNRPLKGLRSIIYENNIIVIGGTTITDPTDTVHIIDTITDTIIVSDMKLAFSTAFTAAIMVDNVMYAFGGNGFDGKWQSQTMASLSTTSVEASIPNNSFTDSVPDSTHNSSNPNTTSSQSEQSDGSDGKTVVTGKGVGVTVVIGVFACLAVVVILLCMYDRGKKNRNRKADNFTQIDGNDQNHKLEYEVNGQFTDSDDDDEKLDTELVQNKNREEYVYCVYDDMN